MYEIAQLALVLALATTLFGGAAAIWSAVRPSRGLLSSTWNAFGLQLGLLTAAFGALLIGLMKVDLGLSYVAGHVSTDLPIFYRITAVWAGNEGSLLFWAWVLSLFTFVVMVQRWKDGKEARWVLGVLAAVELFFLCLLVFVADPFQRIVPAPTEGMGLNPLLQNPGMVFHPPTTYLGYVGFTIPFAYAVAALITGKLDATWIRRTRRWTLFAWTMLSLGILFGAQWAYMELGWGGFWGWDPVENASLMPWLVGTAFLHSVMIQERRGMLKAWNVILIILTFLLSIFGTFLTRSGVISSVHAFSDSGIGPFFAFFIGTSAIFSAVLVAYRWSMLQGDHSLDSVFSRESSFLLNNWVLVVGALVVLWGTAFPLLSEAVTGNKVSVSAPFYNRVMTPIGLILLFLTGVAPLIAWRRASVQNIKRNFTWPALAGLTGVIVAWMLGGRGFAPLIAYGLATFVVGGIALEYARGLKVRRSRHGEAVPVALTRLIGRHRRRYGGYIVHLGVALIVVGITGANSAKQEAEATLNRGEVTTVGDWQVRFNGLRQRQERGVDIVTADLELMKDGKYVGRSYPEKHFHPNNENPMTEVDIRSTPVRDFYVILAGWENQDRATFKLLINPLVWWIWTGGMVLLFGTVVAGWPERRKRKGRVSAPATTRSMAGRMTAGVGVSLLLVFLLPVVARAQTSEVPRTDPGTPTEAAQETVPTVPRPPSPIVNMPSVRALSIEKEILCTCGCENMVVSDCQCGTAAKMRNDIEAAVAAGQSDEAIIAGFVGQYGRWVLAAPTKKGFDLTAWVLPFFFLIGGGLLVALVVRRWTRHPVHVNVKRAGSKPASVEEELMRMRIRRQIKNQV